MTMETNDYVSYPLAIALKAAGFDEDCREFYTPKGDLGSATDADDFNSLGAQYQGEWFSNAISAPILYAAQKWLREKKGVLLWVYPDRQPIDEDFSDDELTGEWWWDIDGKVRESSGDTYPFYEAALSAGIEAALKLLDNENE